MLTILLLGVMFGGVLAGFAIFGSPGEGPGYDFPESHRWHDIQWAAHTGILLVGALIALQFKPATKPVLMQFLVGGTLIVAVVTLALGEPVYLLWLALAVVLALLYTNRAGLTELTHARNPIYLLALALTIVVVLVLAPEALDKFDLQLTDAAGDEHAEHLHWAGGLLLLLQFLLAGILVSSGRPGSSALALLAGASLTFLGLGALVLRGASGVAAVWGATGALLALAGGAGFLLLAAVYARADGARRGVLLAAGD